jgi:hypothetical protein
MIMNKKQETRDKRQPARGRQGYTIYDIRNAPQAASHWPLAKRQETRDKRQHVMLSINFVRHWCHIIFEMFYSALLRAEGDARVHVRYLLSGIPVRSLSRIYFGAGMTLSLFALFPIKVFAVGNDNNSGLGLLDPIQVSYFPIVGGLGGLFVDMDSYSILSWVSFFGNLAIVAVIILWIVRILLIGVEVIRNGENEEKLQEGVKRIKALFIGIVMGMVFPIGLSIIGSRVGIGNIFQWPIMFSFCREGSQYEFFFQAYLQEGSDESARNSCF